ncbi:MAG TPA: PhzF family phenazine biosynthesis protein [Planctomycetota bacterium]|nr:PhzF family phenazine biosynthesis protein [Planctomycetota bacterium]
MATKSSSIPYFLIDAFAERPFEGNSAVVCLLEAPADPQWMQLVAREMNLSETAFVVSRAAGFDLRWFTPTVEVDLCGHATLASAHALWHHGVAGAGAMVKFFTRSGELTARRDGDWIVLDFPSTPAAETVAPEVLTSGLGCAPVWIGKSRFDYLCEFESEAQVRSLAPDMSRLAQLATRGVIATARSKDRFDFVSRFFAPGAGIPEDPVTGSAHCTLGPYWAERSGKTDLVGWQASERGGLVRVNVRGERCLLGGRAFTIAEGQLRAKQVPGIPPPS